MIPKVSEIFCSISGEGISTGKIATFIRLENCNLRCIWCDTKYSYGDNNYKEMLHSEILEEVHKYPTKYVILTGGEPLFYNGIQGLILVLKNAGYKIEIITNGSLPIWKDPKIIWSVDVKCPSSGMTKNNFYSNFDLLTKEDNLKFVISDQKDFEFALGILETLKTPAQVWFQSAWSEDQSLTKQMIEWLKLYPTIRLSTQIHKYIYGQKRGV